MINNDTLVTASIFGISAGVVTEAWSSILIGAIVVGIVQPFFRKFFEHIFKLLRRSKYEKEEKMAYGKRKTKKKEDKKKKRKYKKRK